MSLRLEVELAEARGTDQVERNLLLHGAGSNGGVVRCRWTYRGDLLPPPLDRADAAAVAAVFAAMRAGRDLHVRGPVSRLLLDGLALFIEAWSSWRPDLYRPVVVSADAELEETPCLPSDKAVFAFSGGLDSSTTLFWHASGRAGRRNRDVASAVLVLGFDIADPASPLAQRTEASAREATRALGVGLSIVETDWRRVMSRSWEDDFFTGLAAVMHGYRGAAGGAVIAADAGWPTMKGSTPWGSHFATNALLGSPGFPICTDGGDRSQPGSARILRDAPRAYLANVRVCWKLPESGLNCGVCQKCVRRRLQMRVGGLDDRLMFDQPMPRLGVRHAWLLAPTNEGWASGCTELIREAKAAGGHGSLIRLLRTAQLLALPRMTGRYVMRFLNGQNWRRGGVPRNSIG